MSPGPGSPLAFEALVDDYDAGRPGYPAALYDALPPLPGRRVLELGTGTGLATRGLLERGADVVLSDPGPRMLRRAVRHLGRTAVVARAEALPFAAASFDAVTGAQMWHWVDVAAASAEVARVLRPGGWLALWWNDVDAPGSPWWESQQERLEREHPSYTRQYREADRGAELAATGRFADVTRWAGTWERALDVHTYERWLRSKSYVAELPDTDRFVALSLAELAEAFPDGVVREPFRTTCWVARVA